MNAAPANLEVSDICRTCPTGGYQNPDKANLTKKILNRHLPGNIYNLCNSLFMYEATSTRTVSDMSDMSDTLTGNSHIPAKGKRVTSRSRTSARQAGTRTERAVADYLAAELEDDRIDRRVKMGAKDRGDVSGVRVHGQRLVVEVKDVKHEDCTKCKRVSGLKLPEWTNEAHVEAGNDDALVGVVVFKRNGTTDPGKWWAAMTVDDLAALISGARHGHRKDIA
jgi:hypothetical protein